MAPHGRLQSAGRQVLHQTLLNPAEYGKIWQEDAKSQNATDVFLYDAIGFSWILMLLRLSPGELIGIWCPCPLVLLTSPKLFEHTEFPDLLSFSSCATSFQPKCLASYGWTGSCWIASKSVLQDCQLWPILANFRPFGLYASVLVAFAALPLHNLLLHANSWAWEGTLTPYMIAIRASTSLHLTKSCDVCWHSEPQDTGSNDYLLWQRRVSCWGCLLIQWRSDALSDRVVRWDI